MALGLGQHKFLHALFLHEMINLCFWRLALNDPKPRVAYVPVGILSIFMRLLFYAFWLLTLDASLPRTT